MKLVLPASRNPVNKYTGTSIFCSELKSENLLYFIIVDAGADDTKSADDTCCAIANVGLCGNVIEVDPLSVLTLYDALGTQNHTEGVILREGLENTLNLGDGELLGGLTAEAGEYLVSVVMVVTVVMTSTGAMLVVVVMVMLVFVTVTSAFAMLIVVVVMMLVLVTVTSAFAMLVVVVVMMLVLVAMMLVIVTVSSAFAMLVVVVVMMLVLVTVTSAFAVLIVVVVMMLVIVTVASALAMLVVVVVMMLVLVTVTSAFAMLIVVVMVMIVMMLMLLLELCKCALESILLLHSGEDILAVELVPGSGNDSSGSIVLSDKLDSRLNLLCLGKVGVRKDDGGCVGDLVVIELAKVLHIHLTLVNVGNGGEAIKLGIRGLNRLNRLDNVGEFTYSAGLDDNSVGMELVKHLDKRLGEITDKGAADTSGVHLSDLDACILKKSAVDTDLTELILDEHKLFTAVCFLNKLLYKCGLAGSEEAGKNIYFRHFQKNARGQTS